MSGKRQNEAEASCAPPSGSKIDGWKTAPDANGLWWVKMFDNPVKIAEVRDTEDDAGKAVKTVTFIRHNEFYLDRFLKLRGALWLRCSIPDAPPESGWPDYPNAPSELPTEYDKYKHN